MIELYGKKQLMEAMKHAGLPSTWPTLLEYEKKGIIKRPQRTVKYPDRNWRMYTKEEIVENVRRVRKHVKKETND